MKKELPVDYEIGFADSNILSYTVKTKNITVFLESWNASILEINFLKFISLFSTDDFGISDILEVFDSPFLEKTLENYYEIRSKEHPFRVFKFITSDDTIALEIVCEGISIKKAK